MWSQLKLKPTFHGDDIAVDGVAYITITSADEFEPSVARNCHRLLDNVTYTDLQPPDSFPKIQLQVVRFSMDILDTKQRPPSKRSTSSRDPSRSEHDKGENIQDNESDILLHESVASDDDVDTANTTYRSLVTSQINTRKRKVSGERGQMQRASSTSAPARKLRQSRPPDATLVAPLTRSILPSREELTEIEILVEHAMRLSIIGTCKSSSHVKIKANTVFESLSDIAPMLWKPGYMAAGGSSCRIRV